jgi:hypothetical protein
MNEPSVASRPIAGEYAVGGSSFLRTQVVLAAPAEIVWPNTPAKPRTENRAGSLTLFSPWSNP